MCMIVPYAPRYRDGVVRVVRGVFDEYGFTWDPEGYCRDLCDPEEHYIRPGGMFWAMRDGDEVIGCVGVLHRGRYSELHRMYLSSVYRGKGLGKQLLDACLNRARARGCTAMRAWSDVKLTRAHRLYLKSGFVRDGQRICDDPDRSREYGFWREPL